MDQQGVRVEQHEPHAGEVRRMDCQIEGCTNRTKAVNKLCLEHECRVWYEAMQRLNGTRRA